MRLTAKPHIPESFLEHRQSFDRPWVNQWVLPNPFISALHSALREYGAGLSDFSFARDATSIGDTALNVSIRNLNAAVKVGLDSVVFTAANPDWGDASHLLGVFERVAQIIHQIVGAEPSSQDTTLALHLVADSADLTAASANLVNTSLLGEATFYGVSINRLSGALLIEKSLKYDNAVFLRIHHKFSGGEPFATVAVTMYKEEVFSLGLLGLIDPDEARLP